MANYQTHLTVGAAATAAATAWATTAGHIETGQIPVAVALGVVGSIAPDLDLPYSTPTKIFTNVATVVACGWAILLSGAVAHERAILTVLCFIGVHVGFMLLDRFTVHRGLMHSIPFTFCAAFTVGLVAVHSFGFDRWVAAGFFGMGYAVHLVLDELFAVDFMGVRLKKSFGSALSFGDNSMPVRTLFLYLMGLVLGLFIFYQK